MYLNLEALRQELERTGIISASFKRYLLDMAEGCAVEGYRAGKKAAMAEFRKKSRKKRRSK